MSLPSILLVGAGRMGGALARIWFERGLPPSTIVDPDPSVLPGRTQDRRLASLDAIPPDLAPGAVILAVKPQLAGTLLAPLAGRFPDAVFVSILAGTTLARLTALLGSDHVVRAMPNTPVAVGQGMTVAYADAALPPPLRERAEALLAATGSLAWLPTEAAIDDATPISGCGPAYVFLLAELLEAAARDQGLSPDLARRLARATVAGAGALLAASEEESADLRAGVTSKAGATEAALRVLMAADAWPAAQREAVRAAHRRTRELGAS
jgi:pyrroline-5-carboxylate reductase